MEQRILIRVREYLEDAVFPVPKKKIIAHAKMHHVPENVLEALKKMTDREYASWGDIEKELKSVPFDDGTPKKTRDAILQEKEDHLQQMDNLVNPNEFTKMGDEDNYEA